MFFPATSRNRDSIGDVLSKVIIKNSTILEIGSGSGEHGIFFQKRFPEIIWQTSDPIKLHRKSISSWIEYEKLNMKMPQPLDINVLRVPWKLSLDFINSLQGIVSINMVHVASWQCTEFLFRESGKLLCKGKFLILYGPFRINNEFTSKSNYQFDKSLKFQNKQWGIRNLEEISDEAQKNGFILENLLPMPSNNFIIIFRKF